MREQNIMVWIGRAIVTAIEQNRPHVISHPSLKPAFDAWYGELADSFGEPAQPGFQG